MLPRAVLAALLASTLSVAAAPITIVALGDMPYGEPAEVYPAFEALIGAINERGPDLVIHVGDTKSGITPCSDQVLAEARDYLDSFDAPLLYTPGDNEWTDCHSREAGRFDPRERLAHIRASYFADPTKSFGRTPVTVEHQGAAGYPENVRLRMGDLAVVTAHVVGSNNNFVTRDKSAVDEFFARDAADVAWLQESFAANADAAAIIVAIQADMFDYDFDAYDETWPSRSGFANFGRALKAAADGFAKPVLLIYGDSHIFRYHLPFPQTAPNVEALEVFGAEDMHAVELTVDTALPSPFGVRPLRNPALSVPR